jgi:hypothetical protein
VLLNPPISVFPTSPKTKSDPFLRLGNHIIDREGTYCVLWVIFEVEIIAFGKLWSRQSMPVWLQQATTLWFCWFLHCKMSIILGNNEHNGIVVLFWWGDRVIPTWSKLLHLLDFCPTKQSYIIKGYMSGWRSRWDKCCNDAWYPFNNNLSSPHAFPTIHPKPSLRPKPSIHPKPF